MKLEELESFKAYLDRFGIQHRPGKGTWEVLQVMSPAGDGWRIIHKNKHNRLTVADSLYDLVDRFNEYNK